MTQPRTATSARKILVDWANDQQSWVRAIVREVLGTYQSLPEDVLEDIYARSLSERGLGDEPARVEGKLRLDDKKVEAGDRLLIVSLKNVGGVNLLATGQEIVFHPRITILFGENGSGKTGYVRIFKRGAAVRSAEVVLPNVRSSVPSNPRASIAYKLGDTETVLEWNNEAGIVPLTRISIFDSRAVTFHVDDDLDYVYVPGDLALFPFVTEAIQAIRERLVRARNAAQPSGNPFLPNFAPESSFYGKLEAIGATTDLSELERAVNVAPEEASHLPLLRNRVEALSSNASASQLHSARSERDLYSKIEATARSIADFDWNKYRVTAQDLQSAEGRYKTATEQAFAGVSLPGVLTDAWRDFVIAGESYLKTLQRRNYPLAGDSCLYCGQALNDAALVLLNKYRGYCNNELKSEFDAASRRLREYCVPLARLDMSDLERALVSRISAGHDASGASGMFGKALDLARQCSSMLEKMEAGTSVDASTIVAVASTVAGEVATRLAQAHAIVTDLERKGEEREKALFEAKSSLKDLEDRLKLRELLPSIRRHVEAAKWASKANTIITARFPPLLRSLTEASKAASEDLLNHNFTRHFERECKALRTPAVRLEFPGREGQARRKKSIVSAYRLSEVLSEGEQKVIAIADFLAEAAIRPPPLLSSLMTP